VLAAGVVLGAALIVINGTSRLNVAARSLAASRISLASPARSGETAAAVRVFQRHRLAGAGPGRATLRWAAAGGGIRADAYSHDEYLQVLIDLGVIGAGLLAAYIAAVIGALWRARRDLAGRAAWAGAVAAVAALAVHSGFDFVWHLSAIPLTVAAVVGCAVPSIAWPRPVGAAATNGRRSSD
jgi:O-antigen ligase